MKFDELAQQILENVEGMNTSWEDEDGKIKVTIKDVIKYLDENDIPIKTVSLDKIKPIIIDQDYKNKNKNRVNASSLEYPIIVIKKNGKYKSILDGNHRAFKAVNSNAKNIKVREIDLSSPSTPDEYKELFDYGITPLY
jgi:hypothetical protein